MALTVDDRAVRLLTADEVLRMVQAGILGEDERVELLDGVLTKKPVKSPEHAAVQARLLRWLAPALDRYDVRTDAPIVVPADTYLPEPDLAVVERAGGIAHPTSALLVIEVAIRSLATDLERKPPLYAAAGVPEYWVVDVSGRRLHRFSGPADDGYRAHGTLDGQGVAQPTHVDVAPLALANVFAGL